MSRIPISGIPTTYTDAQAGDTFAMDRGGTMGKITYDDLSAAFIDTLGVGTIQFSTAAMGFGRVTTASASRFDLQATSVADTHERTRLVRDTTAFRHQTGNNSASTFVDDYVATVGASGVTSHQWNVSGVSTFLLSQGLASVAGASSSALDLAATDTTDTHERVRLVKNTTGYGFQTVNAAISSAATDYFATVGASGATRHSWRVNGGGEALAISNIGQLLTNSVLPFTDNASPLGSSLARYTAVWATSGVVSTSDARQKEDINLLTDAEIRLAQRLKSLIRTYRWKSDPTKKHFGVIAQEVIEAFEAEGLDWTQYGVITGGGDEPFGVNYAELHSLILGA